MCFASPLVSFANVYQCRRCCVPVNIPRLETGTDTPSPGLGGASVTPEESWVNSEEPWATNADKFMDSRGTDERWTRGFIGKVLHIDAQLQKLEA